MELRNKVAVITGASRGIGKSIALAFAAEGTNLFLTARRKDLLEEVAQTARQYNVEVEIVAGDLREEAQVKNFIQSAVKKFNRLDILINNAGLGYFKAVAEMTAAEWDEMFDVNLRAVFLATREALPHLRRAGESFVINVASLAGKNTFANGGGYTATKWGLRAFAQCLMLEERKHGVHVVTICPGSVATAFGQGNERSPRSQNTDIIRPEDVAQCLLAAVKMPAQVMVSEIDIRPANP
jgi:NADP-dependent 3-hydroxy acid dehydrogenase YdfG